MGDYIGTQVNVPGTRGKGILRYQGSILGKNGVFAGLELVGPIAQTRGKNNGDVDGKQYFNVKQSMSGLFLPFERLRAVNPQLEYTYDMINDLDLSQSDGILRSPLSQPNHSPLSQYTVSQTPKPKQSLSRQPSIIGQTLGGQTLGGQSPMLVNKTREDRLSMNSFKTPNIGTRSFSLNMERSPSIHRTETGNMAYLEQELFDLRSKYERSEKEMTDKMSILNELRETVQEIQPILKQYETELTDKDRKIAKIKNEFESAREDWRQNLDLVVTTYEGNENYYESKIKELQLKLAEVNTNDYDELKEKYESVKQELESKELETKELVNRESMRSEIEIKGKLETNDRLLELEGKNKQLETEIKDQKEKLQQEINSLSLQLEGFNKIPSDNPNQLGTLIKENESLRRELERRHSLEKLEDKNTELTKLHDEISQLKELLSAKDKEIEGLENSLDTKVKELTSKDTGNQFAEDLMFKDQEIKALEQQLAKTKGIIDSQKNTIRDLQTKDSGGSEQNHHVIELEKTVQELEKTIQELERKLQDSLTKELDSLNINDAAVMNEMTFKKEIESLKRELESRPTIDELTEIQDSLDEMVRLHNNEIFFREETLQKLTAENTHLQTRLERALEGSFNRTSGTVSIEELPVYNPEVKLDPGQGKSNWCGLCERDGHTSLNCPYENDIF